MGAREGDIGRPWEPREQRYVAEWIAREYPNDRYQLRVPVGTGPPGAEEILRNGGNPNMLRPFQRWADAAVFRATEVLLIEAKMRAPTGAIHQLTEYGKLFPRTPQHQADAGKAIRLVLLTPWADADTITLAKDAGVEVRIWQPPWLEAYIAHRQNYTSRTATARRHAAREAQEDE